MKILSLSFLLIYLTVPSLIKTLPNFNFNNIKQSPKRTQYIRTIKKENPLKAIKLLEEESHRNLFNELMALEQGPRNKVINALIENMKMYLEVSNIDEDRDMIFVTTMIAKYPIKELQQIFAKETLRKYPNKIHNFNRILAARNYKLVLNIQDELQIVRPKKNKIMFRNQKYKNYFNPPKIYY